MSFRTDRNRNPTAFTTDLARQAGLEFEKDYKVGDSFQDSGHTFWTAYLLGDPVQLTLRVIDTLGFYSKGGAQRWIYIGIPKFIWNTLNPEQKRAVVGFMYEKEGGTELRNLFVPVAIGVEVSDKTQFGDKLG